MVPIPSRQASQIKMNQGTYILVSCRAFAIKINVYTKDLLSVEGKVTSGAHSIIKNTNRLRTVTGFFKVDQVIAAGSPICSSHLLNA